MRYQSLYTQLTESFAFAFNSLRTNKLRTFLSLLGITIGIFAIISVLTVVSSLERNLRDGISSLGDDIIYVQKWPWGTSGEYPWWKYMKRPLPTVREYQYLKKNLPHLHGAAFMASKNLPISYEQKQVGSVMVMATTEGYTNIKNFELQKGRFLSPFEYSTGKRVIVLGALLAEQLFEDKDPIGQKVDIRGFKLQVIGVLAKEGTSLIDTSLDNVCLLATTTAQNFINIQGGGSNPQIMLKPAEGHSTEEFTAATTKFLRSYRRLPPLTEDNFALNQISLISQSMDELFSVLDLAGWVIGGFSILVGGFGIANIMFVSVREQTRMIGIQKALGAKKIFLLLQFLYESTLLSLIGGTIGLILVFALSQAFSAMFDFKIALNLANILLGLGISASIGILSGFIPALQASRLNPVVAISQQ